MGDASAETRRFGRSAGLLSACVGTSGLATYAYFSLASHTLPKEQYGEIVVLWSATFVAISTLYRPVEQLLSRTIAERRARRQAIGQPLKVAARIQVSVALACTGAALALRGPLQNGLLSGDHTLYWILVGTAGAFGASFFARGFLAGSRRFGLFGALILAESLARMAFALVVAIGLTGGQHAIAVGIVAAPCLSLLVVPLAFLGGASRRRADPIALTAGGASPAPAFTLAQGGGFAAAVLVVMLSEQTFLNGGPLLVKGAVDAATAGFVFNVLMVARAPLLLFQAVATSLLPHLTRLRYGGAGSGQAAFTASVRATLLAIAAFTGLVALAMLAAGPAVMQAAFGHKFSYDRAGLLIITAGMGLYLSASTLNQAAVAKGQVRRAAARWATCAVAFLVWNLLPVLGNVRRVEVGFAGAAALLVALLYLLYRSPYARPEDVVRPESAKELEAQLAAAEEVS